jgi:hypothetical protein
VSISISVCLEGELFASSSRQLFFFSRPFSLFDFLLENFDVFGVGNATSNTLHDTTFGRHSGKKNYF